MKNMIMPGMENTNKDFVAAETWKNLYGAADKLYSLRPWEYICEVDFAEIYLKNSAEPYYCSVAGMCEETAGISVYKGQEGLVSLSNYINSMDQPEYVSMNQKNCIECTWQTETKLNKRDIESEEKAGCDYDSEADRPRFRIHEVGFEPWYLEEDEAKTLTFVMNELYEAVKELTESGKQAEENNGKRIRRRFDEERQTWINELLPPVEEIETVIESCTVKNEVLIRKLKKKRSTGAKIEFDMPYIPTPERLLIHNYRLFYPRMSMLCNVDKHSVESRHFFDMKDKPQDVAMNTIISYIEKKGRPGKVYVRDAKIFGAISHICSSVGVEVILKPDLKMIDRCVEEFMSLLG
ncbi:MAG: hypothetical protein HFE90_07800 [Firmicutes bacterium]|nr:hypothetical protein [Bacillota bacterium]